MRASITKAKLIHALEPVSLKESDYVDFIAQESNPRTIAVRAWFDYGFGRCSYETQPIAAVADGEGFVATIRGESLLQLMQDDKGSIAVVVERGKIILSDGFASFEAPYDNYETPPLQRKIVALFSGDAEVNEKLLTPVFSVAHAMSRGAVFTQYSGVHFSVLQQGLLEIHATDSIRVAGVMIDQPNIDELRENCINDWLLAPRAVSLLKSSAANDVSGVEVAKIIADANSASLFLQFVSGAKYWADLQRNPRLKVEKLLMAKNYSLRASVHSLAIQSLISAAKARRLDVVKFEFTSDSNLRAGDLVFVAAAKNATEPDGSEAIKDFEVPLDQVEDMMEAFDCGNEFIEIGIMGNPNTTEIASVLFSSKSRPLVEAIAKIVRG